MKCDGVWTDFAPFVDFTTPPATAKNHVDGYDIFADTEDLTAHIYPNPTANQVTVSVNMLDTEKAVNIAIIDMIGRIVMEEKTNMDEKTLDISHLNEGYYFVRTENAGATTTTKLAVIR